MFVLKKDLVIKLATNYHQIWGKKKKYDLENIGAGLHNLLVPYELLTEGEKSKYSQFDNELIKFLQSSGYRFNRYTLVECSFRYEIRIFFSFFFLFVLIFQKFFQIFSHTKKNIKSKSLLENNLNDIRHTFK